MTRIAKTVALSVAALACTASPAFADGEYTTDDVRPSWTAASAESCTDPDVSPLLAAFKDDAAYAPAPGGAFETGAAGWQLEGGASVGSAIGGLGVLGASAGALDLPVGAAATSPTFCVDERYTHFRFAYAQESVEADADVRVEVLYPGLSRKNVLRVEDLKAERRRGWQLTKKIELHASHGLKRGGWRLVAIRIHVRDGKPGARVRIDDVLVDPRLRA
jgi:hypothetical protein